MVSMRLTVVLLIGCFLSSCGADLTEPAVEAAAPEIASSEEATPASNTAATASTAEATGTTKTAIAPEPEPEPEPATAQETFALRLGRTCYRLDDGITTTDLRLTLDGANQLQGEARSSVQNDEAAYYTSYTQVFSGALSNGTEATVDITTWIEYDVQQNRETWTVTSDVLETETHVLDRTDCQQMDAVFQDADGLEASDLTDGATAVHRQRVSFAPGESAATVSNSVVRGERDMYLLGASGGQQMYLTITSLEDNAVVDVVSPSGYILLREATDDMVFLPHTGDYQVIVGGTRGNATYELIIGIE